MHGPLARLEYGHNKVQGIDYAYTLQGWLKAINGHKLDATTEIGKDGVAGTDRATVGRDVMAYTLGYFNSDYQPIGGITGTDFNMSFNRQVADASGQNLYNGNISYTTVAISKFNSGAPTAYTYHYDQLNRLVTQRQHALTAGTTTWNHSASMKYAESITYDANGNIKTYVRNGADVSNMPLEMDNLTYRYNYGTDAVTGASYLLNNKLSYVNDAVPDTEYSESKNGTEDLDNQQQGNYVYDKIGNLTKDWSEDLQKVSWTVYGKIGRIEKTNGDYIQYKYDPSGNRVTKEVSSGGMVTKSWYMRDAQGNPLALYTDRKNGQQGFWWDEQSLYGSSRLGMWKPSVDIFDGGNGSAVWNTVGLTNYELTNHLGNVLATITDKKLPHNNGSGGVDYYEAEVVSATDYYPFGMQMPGRKWSSSTYRYGFNGKENDNEVKGLGNQQDYGMRIYDPRLGKFLSVDPLSASYPWNSSYAYSEGDPINYIDLDGLEQNATAAQVAPTRTTPRINVVIDPSLINGTSGGAAIRPRGQMFSNGRINSGNYAPQTRYLSPAEINASIPPNAQGASISPDGRSLIIHGVIGNTWRKSLIENEGPKEQVSWVDRAIVRLREQMHPAQKSTQSMDADASTGSDQLIYRAGSYTDLNFTPRPGKDDGIGPKSGLSAFDNPTQATQGKGGKVQVLSVKALEDMGFVITKTADGHVGIRPQSQEELKKWAESRSTLGVGGTPDINTEKAKAARMGEIKISGNNSAE